PSARAYGRYRTAKHADSSENPYLGYTGSLSACWGFSAVAEPGPAMSESAPRERQSRCARPAARAHPSAGTQRHAVPPYASLWLQCCGPGEGPSRYNHPLVNFDWGSRATLDSLPSPNESGALV